MKVQRFEDLIAWQKSRALTAAIYRLTKGKVLVRDFGLSGQLQRAAASIMANIAEGFERHRSGEFHQFLSIAKGSCAEVRSHLYVALDAEYISEKQFTELLTMAEDVGRLIGGLRASLKGHPNNHPRSSSTQHTAPSTQH